LEIGQLEAFERVAREGSFTRAADALGLTQPAVSTRISTLEAELKGALFERKGRQLVLSPLGERFLPYAQRMLVVMSESLQTVQNYHENKLGEVRIAAPTPFLLSFLMDTLSAFRQEHPTVDILIRERNKTTIFDLLLDNAMTLGLVNAPVFDRSFIHLARFRDPIVAVVGQGHPLAQADKSLAMDAIYQYTIYRVSMFPQMTAFIDEVVEDGRRGSGGAVIALPMVMARELVLTGEGVTFLPESYIKQALVDGRLVRLAITDMPQLYSEPILIALKSRKLDAVHTLFCNILVSRWRHLLIKSVVGTLP
jgi:DNA-binding transcriptional LysR family regulator